MNIQNRQYLNNIKGIGYNVSEQIGSDPQDPPTADPRRALRGTGGGGQKKRPRPEIDSGGPSTDEEMLQWIIDNWDNNPNSLNLLLNLLANWGAGSPPPLHSIIAQVQENTQVDMINQLNENGFLDWYLRWVLRQSKKWIDRMNPFLDWLEGPGNTDTGTGTGTKRPPASSPGGSPMFPAHK